MVLSLNLYGYRIVLFWRKPIMYKINMKQTREREDDVQSALDTSEAKKNPLVPGARIIRGADAVPVYVNETACRQWFYPLSEVNDLGLFTYIEKEAKQYEEYVRTLINLHMELIPYLYK